MNIQKVKVNVQVEVTISSQELLDLNRQDELLPADDPLWSVCNKVRQDLDCYEEYNVTILSTE